MSVTGLKLTQLAAIAFTVLFMYLVSWGDYTRTLSSTYQFLHSLVTEKSNNINDVKDFVENVSRNIIYTILTRRVEGTNTEETYLVERTDFKSCFLRSPPLFEPYKVNDKVTCTAPVLSAVSVNQDPTLGTYVSRVGSGSGQGIHSDYRDVLVIGAWGRITIDGKLYVLIAEIDFWEVFGPLIMRNSIWLIVMLGFLFVVLVVLRRAEEVARSDKAAIRQLSSLLKKDVKNSYAD